MQRAEDQRVDARAVQSRPAHWNDGPQHQPPLGPFSRCARRRAAVWITTMFNLP